uniref:Calponin-homology (CH) domain-containing protein n=1 Tax=Macrostomum lignano TaxID=282301 RepID=A0A1I8G7R3_9PLAT
MANSASLEANPDPERAEDSESVGKFQQSLDRALELIRDDLCEWLSQLLELSTPIDPENYLDYLENGVLLCRLMQKMQSAAGQSPRRCHQSARAGSFLARDNISVFLTWCRSDQRLDDVLLFETSGLVERREERNLVLTLLQLARACPNLGLPAPQIVRLEREIDGLSTSTSTSGAVAAATPTMIELSAASTSSEASNDEFGACASAGSGYVRQRSSSAGDICDGSVGSAPTPKKKSDARQPTDSGKNGNAGGNGLKSAAQKVKPTSATRKSTTSTSTAAGSAGGSKTDRTQQLRKQSLQQQQPLRSLKQNQQTAQQQLQRKPQRPSSAG